MKKITGLYAIYKSGYHKGNERGHSASEAIKNYIKDSDFEDFLNDKLFIAQYSATKAIEGMHYETYGK